jgi:hypothetical protein
MNDQFMMVHSAYMEMRVLISLFLLSNFASVLNNLPSFVLTNLPKSAFPISHQFYQVPHILLNFLFFEG